MPLDLADALRRHLLQRFPATRDYPRDALRAEGMPPLVAAFLERALDRWLEIERDGLRSDWFDFDAPGVQTAEARFFDVLAETARVPAEAWKPTLGGAVDLVVRFLTTPARALTDALFEGDSDPLPTPEIRRRLKLFAAYLYFPEVAAAYLDKKQPESLDPNTLFDLLDRIDRRIVREYGPDDWLALLDPLFALARYVPTFDGVPASLLQRFFRAKGYDEVAEMLESHLGQTVDKPTLRALLEPEAHSTPEQHSAQEETPPAPPLEPAVGFVEHHLDPAPLGALDAEAESEYEEVLAEPEAVNVDTEVGAEPDDVDTAEVSEPGPARVAPSAPVLNEAAPLVEETPVAKEQDAEETKADDEADEPVPLWQRYAGAQPEPEAEETADADDAPLWKRFSPSSAAPTTSAPAAAPVTPAASRAPIAEIEARVLGSTGPGQRARFIKHLFKGDQSAYTAVLRTLDEAETWTEASRIIARDVFRRYTINIYGEHAVAFTDAVEARYGG